ncbi:Voltage-gated potassium channel Kch [Acaryochloris thomasi RCC1774]|uniref:Voltage-gated potassium channel Kch n=1 Tax=Acaryochloris thomasi RCC1774 TaxID=1764569 RepID=A0A2W1JJ72_9CYAN|nr:Voltage-gated potassium channel Kch [Acaryochloris thomasi RCC1774]
MIHRAFQRIWTGIALFALTIIVAVIGYIALGWTFSDAVYMVVITIFGVGYGEVEPLDTTAERIFTIFVIVAGTSSVIYIVGGFVQMVTEGELNRAFDTQRKSRTIAKLNDHVIVCGFGRIGRVLAQQLDEAKQAFIVLDNNPERVAMAETRGYLVHTGSASDEACLQDVGIERAKFLATVLPDDATNVFITLTAHELNPELLILARGESITTEKKLRLAGADHVVLPSSVSGHRIANLITQPTALDVLAQNNERTALNELLTQIDLQMEELEVKKNSRLLGRTIGEVEVRAKGAFIVVALRQLDGETINRPGVSLSLNVGDVLVLLGHEGAIAKFAHRYQYQSELSYQGGPV